MSRTLLREELIQAAAVIVAFVEDMDYGIADFAAHDRSPRRNNASYVFKDIAAERRRQDLKWGPQTHKLSLWMAILGEEIGEAVDELGIQEWTWSLQEKSGLNAGLHLMGDAGLDLKETLDTFYFPKGETDDA